MLKRNTSDSFPGADFVAADPVSAADCCLQQSVALIIVQLRILDIPFIMRGGRLYFDQSDAGQITMCQGAAPLITGMSTTDWDDAAVVSIQCSDMGAVQGEVWVGDAATWAASVLRVEQTVDTWVPPNIGITTVQGGFPNSPPPAYAYVMNGCGRPSAAGYEIAWTGL